VKARADMLLVQQGLASSRTVAQSLILAGQVYSGEQRVDKAGQQLAEGTVLVVRGRRKYVSRGGDKLEGALADLGVEVRDLVALDVGASTGGFTDCLLQHGARKVFAVDVGHGQLATSLCADPRVVNLERTNARHLQPTELGEPIELVVVDASFIGLDKLLPAITALASVGTRLVALVKPQFEVGRDEARRTRGVIRDPQVRADAIARVTLQVQAAGWLVVAGADCRVAGPKGNVEYFLHAVRQSS
jgi:23S rRNA (cytidine1920-2'-O)/16S rRNA (cytidine1409-2'-O)-methyltransferase